MIKKGINPNFEKFFRSIFKIPLDVLRKVQGAKSCRFEGRPLCFTLV